MWLEDAGITMGPRSFLHIGARSILRFGRNKEINLVVSFGLLSHTRLS